MKIKNTIAHNYEAKDYFYLQEVATIGAKIVIFALDSTCYYFFWLQRLTMQNQSFASCAFVSPNAIVLFF